MTSVKSASERGDAQQLPLGLALLHGLKAHGAREIFGIPGDFIVPFFRQIEEAGVLPLYALSHEPALGFAADAAARVNCGLGVVAVTYGAGALNLVNPIAGAYAERSPVVVIAGSPGKLEACSGLALHHQVKTLDSQYRILREITCDQVCLEDPDTAAADIARVLRSCREHSQPVLIELPRDIVGRACAPVPVLPASAWSEAAVAEAADEWMALLARATSPVLLVDVEVRRFHLEAQVAELARRLGVPVVTTFMGRGLLAETDLAVHGTYLGVAGHGELTDLVESSDLLMMLGCILSDSSFGVAGKSLDFRRALIAAGREVRIGHHLYPDLPLAALVPALLERARPRAPSSLPRPVAYAHGLPRDSTRLRASDLSVALNDQIRARGPFPIASDIGDCLFCAMELAPTPMVAPGYYASMGFGVPAGMGVQLTSGRRPVILVGDGAFQMTGWELGNCRRYGLDPIVLVLNNQTWEMIRVFEPASRCSALGDWHYAELARSVGGHGDRVTTRAELAAALDRAFERRGAFSLIEVMLEPGDCTHTLRRFASGIQALRAQHGR